MKTLQLTARTIDAAREPGHYGDGSGLYLQISDYGTRSWVFRYKLNGKAHEMGLGSVNTFSLKEARERARAARQLLADGIDPIQAKREKRATALADEAKRITFEEASCLYIRAHEKAWEKRHRDQWQASLEQHAFPVLGKLTVDAIELPHVRRVLEPMWNDKTETASRVRKRIERVLAWATVGGFRQGDNPARWDGHLAEMLPSRAKLQAVQHMAAMPFAELPAFMADLTEREGITARALAFTILTAARTGEIVGATWDEIDLKEKVWIIPAARMKAGRDHRVPLSAHAVELLEKLPRSEGGRVFPIHSMSMVRLLHKTHDGLTVHGFRSTFSDWCRERTNYPRDVVEMALAHAIKDRTEAASRRGDALEKRRRLMGDWARYCSSPVQVEGKVVPLHGSGTST
jgi:integrase